LAIDKSILVTGASGFLGSHVVRELVNDGVRVAVAVRPSAKLWRLEAMSVSPARWSRIDFDLADDTSINAAFATAQPTTIIHCAAYGVGYGEQDLSLAVRNNVIGVARMIEAAADAKVARFVHIGTCYEYGSHADPISESATLRPRGIYGTTKASGSLVALDRAASLGVNLAVLRPFGMYGPFEEHTKVVPQMLNASRTKTRLPMTLGAQVRDYTFVGDIATVIYAVAKGDHFRPGGIFNVGSGAPITLRQLGVATEATIGTSGYLDWGAREYRKDEMMSLVADTSAIHLATGWSPTTSLQFGLRQVADARFETHVSC